MNRFSVVVATRLYFCLVLTESHLNNSPAYFPHYHRFTVHLVLGLYKTRSGRCGSMFTYRAIVVIRNIFALSCRYHKLTATFINIITNLSPTCFTTLTSYVVCIALFVPYSVHFTSARSCTCVYSFLFHLVV